MSSPSIRNGSRLKMFGMLTAILNGLTFPYDSVNATPSSSSFTRFLLLIDRRENFLCIRVKVSCPMKVFIMKTDPSSTQPSNMPSSMSR